MNKSIFFSIAILIGFALQLSGQPTGKKVLEQSSEMLKVSGQNAEEIQHKEKVEKEYLENALQNIETYRKGDASIVFKDKQGIALKNIKVEVNQLTQDFLFGNIVWELSMFSNDSYKVDEFKERFKYLFNFAVVPYYWEAYEKEAGHPLWQGNDDAIDWCLANGITCKGHPLAWTSPAGTPKWLLQQSPEIATELLKARIQNNVIGYKGKVDMWDVVNEPVNTVPWELALADTANTNDFRYNMNGVIVDQITPWVAKSYQWANEANPEGNYILNEYFTLAIPEVRNRFYTLLKNLQTENIPVKGIGIQAHEPREMWFSPVEFYKTLDLYSEFNLPIHITELIPQSSGKEITGWRTGIWTEQAQAEFAEQFYTLAFAHPSVVSITWWGLSDRDIWLKGGGLLDEEYNPKPVYNTLYNLIKQKWMTRDLKLLTSGKGALDFRGFFGEYEIKATGPDGIEHKTRIHLKENGKNEWTVEL